ncbi:MAG: hypothetical protein R2875_07180 [Desulfobacterales bacterium]
MKLLGPTTLAMGTAESSFPNSIPDPYYPVGVIAGTVTDNDNEDTIPGIDDGLVALESTKVNNMTDFITLLKAVAGCCATTRKLPFRQSRFCTMPSLKNIKKYKIIWPLLKWL